MGGFNLFLLVFFLCVKNGFVGYSIGNEYDYDDDEENRDIKSKAEDSKIECILFWMHILTTFLCGTGIHT